MLSGWMDAMFPVDFRTIAQAQAKMSIGVLLVFFLVLCEPCRSQEPRYLCSDGYGTFTATFSTRVTVTVGAAKSDGFASHTCDASLRWGKHVTQVVAGAYRVDIDVLGADLGFNEPGVAFQIQNAEQDRLMTYQIYSLRKSPRLLSTITGGDSYDARDRNLEGRVEIWTDDAGAVDGFENLPLSSFDFLPTVALRFEKRKLTDVTPEFQPYFDREIAQIRAHLNVRALREFKNTDGKLSSIPPQLLGNLHAVMRTKIAILEIVWAYLYSGREQNAWSTLASMWPPADFNRIRDAIQNARTHGILRQVHAQEAAKPRVPVPWKHHAVIYNMVRERKQVLSGSATNMMEMQAGIMGSAGAPGEETPTSVDSRPKPIFVGIPHRSSDQMAMPTSEIFFNLVIDAAGKVHSAKLVNKADAGPGAETDIRASATWNFIPGFRGGRPVACQFRLGVSPQQ